MSNETKTPDSAEDSASLRADIEETRAEMSETIDAIQAKLDPQHIKAEVAEKIHDATIGRVQEMAHAAGEKISPTVDFVEDKFEDTVKMVGAVAGSVAQTARVKSGEVVKLAKRQPVMAAAAGVAVAGVLIGWQLLAPRSGWKVPRR